MKIISKIRKRFGLYDLRAEGAKWVRKEFGEEYVEEFLEKYDNVCSGVPTCDKKPKRPKFMPKTGVCDIA